MITELWDKAGWLYILALYLFLFVANQPHAIAVLGWVMASITLYGVVNIEKVSLR